MRTSLEPSGSASGTRPARSVLVAHPSADRYGSDRMLLESVAGFVEAGWRVVVTVPDDGPLAPMLRELGADVVLCPAPRLSKAALSPRGALRLVADTVRGTVAGLRLLRAHRPDALYVSTVTVPWWFVLARLVRVPTVAHVHEAERAVPRPVRVALALPLLLARSVVANSDFAVRVLRDSLPGVARRASVVRNGVLGPPEAPGPARAELAPPVRLLYLGRLSPRKGVDVAVRAVAALRDGGLPARLDVVGEVFPGYEWYREELAATVDRLGLGDDVRLHGFCDDVWPFIAACDVLVVPSRLDEPFGNTAVEGVLSARPVVVSRSGGLVEAVEGYACATLVEPDDPDALAAAVRAVVADWPRVRERAVADAATARERHAPARYRSRIVEAVAAVTRSR